MKEPVRETRQLSMHRRGAGLGREARLNLAPPFQSLIMRLIYPVTYVTILPYDLLFSRPDGEIGPKREGGEGDCLKAANLHALCDWVGPRLWQPQCICVYKVGCMSKAKIH